MLSPDHERLSIVRQCQLLGINRSSIYYRRVALDTAEDLILLDLIDRQYLQTPFYGSRKMVVHLRSLGHQVNRKRVRRLMAKMGIAAIYPGPKTSTPHPEHRKFPYLLRGVTIERPNQVWSVDITYLPMARGFMFLVAIMDWYSRKVLSWRVSNTLDTRFCLEALEEALERYGNPEIFNSDQGSQFTSDDFVNMLKNRGIRISMDGRGRCHDNIFIERLWRSVKYECVYIRAFENGSKLRAGLGEYFEFYNQMRPHQSLGYQTPNELYLQGDDLLQAA